MSGRRSATGQIEQERQAALALGAARARAGGCIAPTLLLCMLTAAVSAAGGWGPFLSESGRFAVELPAPPRITETQQRSLVGTVESAEYLVQAGSLELRVEHHDIPALAAFFVSEQGLLERAQDDLVSGEQAREQSASERRVGDRWLREVHYRLLEEGGRDGRARLQMVGERLYVQAALFPRESADDPALERFFSSFEAWE